MKFTVETDKWLRNRASEPNKPQDYYPEYSMLYKKNTGNMCCLGFCMRQLGFYEYQIDGQAYPASVLNWLGDTDHEITPELASFVICDSDPDRVLPHYKSSSLATEAVVINDNSRTTDAEKMDDLKALFSKYGHDIEFV